MLKINDKRLIKSFIEMVSISSESGHESDFAKYIMSEANKLDLETRRDKYGNVYIFFPGEGEPIMLNTHMDTVSPGRGISARVSGKYIVSDRKTILGADSKAGIAAMMEMIKTTKENRLHHHPVHITLTCNEESGIPTADKIVSNVGTCLVPDRGTPIGEIIIEAPYAQVFEVIIEGKTAYAPSNFNDGIHAIIAANLIIKSLPWGNIDKFTTTNIGLISGGEMTSMIARSCIFKGSCYSFNKNSLDNFLNKLHKVAKKTDLKVGTKTTIKMLEYFGGYKLTKTDPFVAMVKNAIEKSEITPKFKIYKAVTNANHLNQIGIKSVLISTGVENQHTVKERILIDSLIKTTKIITNLVTSDPR
jgi:tripeptide aminopeptidase